MRTGPGKPGRHRKARGNTMNRYDARRTSEIDEEIARKEQERSALKAEETAKHLLFMAMPSDDPRSLPLEYELDDLCGRLDDLGDEIGLLKIELGEIENGLGAWTEAA